MQPAAYSPATALQTTVSRRRNAGLKAVVAVLLAWSERHRMRRGLAALSEHSLRDIGLSRDEIMREAEKPFWRV